MRLNAGPKELGELKTPYSAPGDCAFRRRVLRISIAATSALMLLSACATTPPATPPEPLSPPPIPKGVEDQRGRFREIFCAILEERSEELPDARPCNEALTRVGTEPDATGRPVHLGLSDRHLVAVFVPGLGWDCVSDWLDLSGSVTAHLHRFGFELSAIDVEGMSGSTANARLIRATIMAMEPTGREPDLVLVGYSKGAPDILEAVVAYPEIRPRIAAVVSVAGAVGGSPVADEVTQSQAALLRRWPGSDCSTGDAGGVDSLRPAVRRAWLAENLLPDEIAYYSLLTTPARNRVSSALKPSYRKLSKIDPHNDGMVLFSDQFIPGSTFVGCVNADHWAVAVPIARSHPMVASTLVSDNDYPREALLEAVLRFVEEDLATRGR